MISSLLTALSYGFFQRALVVGLLVSLCAALLGVSLVLKHYSMIGDGLGHVSFGALSIALCNGWAPLPFSIPVVVLSAFGLLRLAEKKHINSDAAIAVFSAASLALGVTVISLTPGMSVSVESYMFGSILALSQEDVIFSVVLSVIVLLLFSVLYHQLFAITFDESFAQATGMKVRLYRSLLSVLTALTVVLGLRLIGAMLISSLIIFPALSAMRICKSFRSVTIFAAICSVVNFLVGLFLSYGFSTPTGATIVLCHFISFLLCILVGKIRQKTTKSR